MTTSFDLIIIGAGPGGYHAAYLAGKSGLRTALIERDKLGGVCLNAGCIPTKALLRSTKAYLSVKEAATFGVDAVGEPHFNLLRAMDRKETIVDELREGVRALMARHQVDVIAGEAEFIDRQTVRVGDDTYTADNLLIATGAAPIPLDVPGADRPQVLNTADILSRGQLPQQLAIIGGNPISLGFASIFAPLGVTVHIITDADEITPEVDAEIAALLRESLPDVRFHLGADVDEITEDGVVLASGDTLRADTVLANIGRQPNINGLDAIGVDTAGGRVHVDEHMQTNLPNIYAVGDVTGRSMWAHTAIQAAEVAIKSIRGEAATMRYDHIPTPVYSIPEAASVGLTEGDAQAAGREVRVARLPLDANGRYRVDHRESAARGLCKIITDAQTNVLLGVHLLGTGSTDMIFGAVTLLADEFRVQDVIDLPIAHPTVPEILKDTLHTLKIPTGG